MKWFYSFLCSVDVWTCSTNQEVLVTQIHFLIITALSTYSYQNIASIAKKEIIVGLLLKMEGLSVEKLSIFKLAGHLITDAIKFTMKSMKSIQ